MLAMLKGCVKTHPTSFRVCPMRYKVSQWNIEIDPVPEGTQAVVLSLIDILVPHWTPTLFFASQRHANYPRLEERSSGRADVRVVDYEHNRGPLVSKFRIIEFDDGILCVVDEPRRMTVKDRKQICRLLKERLL
jgi:hypothetical protein